MKKTVRLTENDLTKIIKKVINEQNFAKVKMFARDIIKGSKFKFTTIEDALKALRSTPHLIEELDLVVVSAINTKKIDDLNYLQAQVFEELKNIKGLSDEEALNQTKNYLNAYAKEKGYNNFSELRKLAEKNEQQISKIKSASSSGVGQIGDSFFDLPEWIHKWVTPSGNKNPYIASLFEKVHKLEKLPFNPKEIKVLNKTRYNSIERGKPIQRDVLEIQLPTSDKIIVYTSSGTGAPELKQSGDWQVISGWNPNPNNTNDIGWFIKDEGTTQLTKGLNPYLTKLDNFLKKNGPNSLGN